jgi:hypothetical protein
MDEEYTLKDMDINSNTIISDCVDINNSIIVAKNSAKIKLIGNLKYRYYRRKFINIINRLPKVNQPLSKDNIYELISYIYNNNVQDTCSFGYINNIKEIFVEGIPSYMFCTIKANDNVTARLKVSVLGDTFILDLHYVDEAGNGHSFNNIELDKMESNNKDIKEYVDQINKCLISTLSDFVVTSIIF